MNRLSFHESQQYVALALCLGLAGATAEFAVACSSSSTAETTCGAGTELRNGECVVAADASASMDATSSADGNGAADGGADGFPLDDAGCPTGVGTPMVRIPLPDGGSFCIDATEVTRAQYNAFLASTGGDMSGQPTSCAWNTTYAPPNGCMDGGGLDDYPMACVDWCDAYAYCASVGKNLCGSVANILPSNWVQAQTAWACSSGGEDVFPYGNTFVEGACQQPANGMPLSGPVAVGSKTACHGFGPQFSEVFDLVGNVSEWLGCDPSQQATCAAQAGDWYYQPAFEFDCSGSIDAPPDAAGPSLGLRCCADYHQNGM